MSARKQIFHVDRSAQTDPTFSGLISCCVCKQAKTLSNSRSPLKSYCSCIDVVIAVRSKPLIQCRVEAISLLMGHASWGEKMETES